MASSVTELMMRRMGAKSGSSVDWETLCIGILSGDISTINIPEGVTKLRGYALAYTQATTITLPSTLTTLDGTGWQLGVNPNLVNLDLGTGITSISQAMVRGCTSLKDVILPAQITYINYVAFYGLRSWTLTMLREASVVTKHNVIWDEAPQAIYVPDAVVSTYQSSTAWSSFASLIKPLSQKP
jgi:hypothetical protein